MREVLDGYPYLPGAHFMRKCKIREYTCENIGDFRDHRGHIEATSAPFFSKAKA